MSDITLVEYWIREYGVPIAMLLTFIVMYWWERRARDKMVDAMNKERRDQYQHMEKLVIEVTKALSDKNHTDDQMADALSALTNVIRDKLQEKKDETT